MNAVRFEWIDESGKYQLLGAYWDVGIPYMLGPSNPRIHEYFSDIVGLDIWFYKFIDS